MINRRFILNRRREGSKSRAEIVRAMLPFSAALLPDWGDRSWACGAAALVTHRLFDCETHGGTVGTVHTDELLRA